jgi:tetratricopeptide (TPR) repeat protein
MGIAAMDLAQYDKALSYHFQSLILREEEGSTKSIPNALSNIGLVYFKLIDPAKALNYYNRAVKLKWELKDSVDIETMLINMGHCLNQLKQYTKAIELANQALSLCGDNCRQDIIIEAYSCIGNAYLNFDSFKNAEDFYSRALKLSEDLNDIDHSMICLIGLGQIEFARKNYDQSLRYLLRALEKSNSTDYPEMLMNIHKYLARAYKQKSDLQYAFEHQSIQLQLLDSIYNAAFARSLAKVQTEHEERENRKALADKDKLVTLQAEALQTQQRISLFGGLIVLLSIIVILSIYRNYRLRVRINKVLEEKVKLRTRELEESRDNALRNAYLQDHRLTRITNDVQDTLVTIQGLCLAARLEVAEGARIYLDKLEDHTCSLKATLSRFNMENSPLHQKVLL